MGPGGPGGGPGGGGPGFGGPGGPGGGPGFGGPGGGPGFGGPGGPGWGPGGGPFGPGGPWGPGGFFGGFANDGFWDLGLAIEACHACAVAGCCKIALVDLEAHTVLLALADPHHSDLTMVEREQLIKLEAVGFVS
ncbi:hypothetical protein Tsubulata_045573 [Turnera subulata]|uniref:Uncharacterized protein n=1 Tax=Turnera subulata TaxID=218843 RepID=A0A9Q0GCG6_9ROSI|nr:hypothetical protein Tsubulata_045573 [Turnera subulata]